MSVLSIRGLSKNYGKLQALDNLSLEIEPGKIYGILGPNGSGKTTTLAILLGIKAQSSGDFVWFNGEYGDKYRMKIGAILETPNFYPYLDAVKNLEIIQDIKNHHTDDIDAILESVNLSERKHSKFRTYSLGMKQRLAIAATLIGDPEVLIFVEPTNGLDPEGIAEIRNILHRVANSGKTVILASHLLNEVEKICTDVAIIKRGKLLATGPVGNILTDDITIDVKAEDLSVLENFLRSIDWITSIKRAGDVIECSVPNNRNAAELNKLAFERGIYLTHLVSRKKNLEEEFLAITNLKSDLI